MKKDNGFSVLELIVVVTVIGILATFAVDRLWAVQIDAENTAMENVVGSLRSALGMKVAQYIAKSDINGLKSLEGGNPMEELVEPPKNYVGAITNPDPASVAGGNWYFDANAKALVYRVHNADSFSSKLGMPARARFGVQLVYQAQDKNVNPHVVGVRLVALEPYRWVNE